MTPNWVSESVPWSQEALMCNRYHSRDKGYIKQYWRLKPRQLGLGCPRVRARQGIIRAPLTILATAKKGRADGLILVQQDT